MSKSKIHPAVLPQYDSPVTDSTKPRFQDGDRPSKLTVWKRSSMSFQGTDGFTVFDHHGRLVFRVDNYSRRNPSTLLLMDGDGNPLVTLKPQRLSTKKQWSAYAGENRIGKGETTPKLFSMRTRSGIFQSKSKTEAEVLMGGGKRKSQAEFRIEGSFRRRNCDVVRVADSQVVAKITRKRANSRVLLGDEVFSLELLQSAAEFQAELVMAFVVVLDRISPKSSVAPVLCS